MIAVLMMYRNEEDIIGQCIDHWAKLGVDAFYLCNNNSTDKSIEIVAHCTTKLNLEATFIHRKDDDFPQRKVINELKSMAIQDGHQWIFPIDADEFLNLNGEFKDIQHWLEHWEVGIKGYTYGQYRYKNIMPNGVSWWEPEHKKVFGRLNPDWNISIGNHEIEQDADYRYFGFGVHLNHYQYRSYDQFKRKKLTFFKAFEKAGYLDHKFVKEYRLYQKHGEAYLEQMWDYLLRGITEFEFKP